MHVRPLHDWIVVSLDPIKEVTASGIILPSDTELRQRTGTVLRVGPGRNGREVRVRPGDVVAFVREHLEHKSGKTTTRLVHELEKDTAMIRAADILFVIEEP